MNGIKGLKVLHVTSEEERGMGFKKRAPWSPGLRPYKKPDLFRAKTAAATNV